MMEIDVAKIKYPNNFLKNVIFRVDFDPILSINDQIESSFQENIRSMFPRFDIKPGTQVSTEFKKGAATSKAEQFNQYIFQNESKNRKLTVANKYIILEVSDFNGFDEYKEMVRKIVNNFYNIYSPIVINRLGLRYINEISLRDGSPFEWEGFVNSDLIRLINSDLIEKGSTSRVMSQIIYNKEEYNVTFTFGISNSEFPSPISRREFILDYDCSTKEAEFDNINNYIEEYNKAAVTLFENSIGDKLRNLMKGEEK